MQACGKSLLERFLTNKLRPKSLLQHLWRSPWNWFYLGLWAASRKIPKSSRDWNKILRHGRHGLGSHRTCAVLQVKDWFWSRLRQRMWLKAVGQVPDTATGRLSGRFTSVGCVELLQWGPGRFRPHGLVVGANSCHAARVKSPVRKALWRAASWNSKEKSKYYWRYDGFPSQFNFNITSRNQANL